MESDRWIVFLLFLKSARMVSHTESRTRTRALAGFRRGPLWMTPYKIFIDMPPRHDCPGASLMILYSGSKVAAGCLPESQ